MSDIARCAFHGTSPGGEIWQFSLWVERDILTQADADAMAEDAALAADTSTLFADILAADQTWTGVSAYCYTGASTSADFIGEASRSVTGTASGVQALQVALVVTLNTNQSGRSGRGRIFLPARPQSAGAGGLINSVSQGDVADDVQTIVNGINSSATPSLVVVHSVKLGADFPITGISLDQRLDVQRRRANRQTTGTRVTRSIP